MDNQLNGADAMVRMLQAQGVQHIFGLCGDTSLPLYDSLRGLDHGITHILTRDERSATYMADAYARVTGRPGICEGPSGGGATYILPGLIEANESSYAVLAITSDISVASYGKFPLTEVDQEALMRPLTKWNAVIRDATHIPRMVRAAFRAMTTGRPGAAHLGLPYDIQYDPVAPEEIWADPRTAQFPAYPAAPEPGAAEAVVDALLTARTPLAVCGGGVVIAGAEADLARLASRLDLAVATSISGQGAVAETHPQAVGVVGSNGGTDATWSAMTAADLVLFLGCRAGSTTTARWEAPGPDTRILHIDSDPAVIGANYKTEIGVVADLKLALAEINRVLDAREAASPPPQGTVSLGGAARAAAIWAEKTAEVTPRATDDSRPIRPERLIAALHTVLPEEAVVLSDPGTSCPYLSAQYRLPRAGRHFITNRAHGALGYALPAALGAWYGRPGAKIVSVMGDGSFGFACGELETVCRAGADITFVVLSNASFGWIKASQKTDKGGRYHNVDFGRSDHAAIAAGFGLRSWRVEDPADLVPTLRLAVGTDGPTLVDVICQPLEEAAAPVRRWMG